MEPPAGVVYLWSMTAVVPALETGKQRLVRERIDALIATLSPGEPLPAERELSRELAPVRAKRRATKPSRAAKARRVDQKKQRSEVKRGRGKVDF